MYTPSRDSARDAIAPAKPSSREIVSTTSSSAADAMNTGSPSTGMVLREVERVAIDQRPEHGLPGLRGDLAHVVDPEPLQDRRRTVRRLAHPCVAGAEAHEDELGERGLGQLAPADQPAPAKGPGERERAGAREQRPIEVEERGPRPRATDIRD